MIYDVLEHLLDVSDGVCGAPCIVEAICSGRQPADLTAARLTRRASLPYEWAEQQKALGLGNSLKEVSVQ
jgi:hypothetical protein